MCVDRCGVPILGTNKSCYPPFCSLWGLKSILFRQLWLVKHFWRCEDIIHAWYEFAHDKILKGAVICWCPCQFRCGWKGKLMLRCSVDGGRGGRPRTRQDVCRGGILRSWWDFCWKGRQVTWATTAEPCWQNRPTDSRRGNRRVGGTSRLSNTGRVGKTGNLNNRTRNRQTGNGTVRVLQLSGKVVMENWHLQR